MEKQSKEQRLQAIRDRNEAIRAKLPLKTIQGGEWKEGGTEGKQLTIPLYDKDENGIFYQNGLGFY